ncbi:MarR family winged helix-turn-helix transcriptional regulator [Sphingomonas nostoxanthinifaciens]|uniref:MarR family winged helix-turn-helix transcriptional regulator n=1 Tax=Sphingomonas nostoxanthinifaciens TaxID=2872652 RepID=UPI001CC2066A|nr:MarR family transcriptional regulator [Sphingomonas nostoxanthinifaciens]UAK24292.1 MarR family transcriptional regulator [Sphingomonas nostoxanthinifaciens]
MAVPSASPLFLRETEIRRGIELLYFGYSLLYRDIDHRLGKEGLGRAHHRALYFIARQPDQTISDLLRTLAITKQSLGRVLGELTERGLVETRTGRADRRQRLLRLTESGEAMERDLFEAMRERLGGAYAGAGQEAVTGFWRVLEAMIPPADRGRMAVLADAAPDGRAA